jgi:acyl-CoA oxidase
MYEESDLIQGLAQAHSERVIFEACVDTLGSCEDSLKPILTQLLLLTAIDWIEKDLGWFVSQKVITSRLGTKVPEYGRKLCAQIAPSAIQLIDAFGIPEHMRHAPISGDWIKYNQIDNFGELLPELQNKSHVKTT